MRVTWSAVFLNADYHSDFTSSLGQRSAGDTGGGGGPLGGPRQGSGEGRAVSTSADSL